MDSNIEKLLERYWNCETSLEEEKELRDYFQANEVPEELRDTARLFQYFEYQKKQSLNKGDFDQVVKSKLKSGGSGKVIKMVFTYAKIAAGLLVLVAASYLVRQEIRKSYPEEIADTYSDPQIAFEETKRALMMISKSFNKAQHETSKIRIFNEAEQVIQNGTEATTSTDKANI